MAIIALLHSCSKPQAQSESAADSVITLTDTIAALPEKESPLIRLLNHPLDLKEYKIKKRGANSSFISKAPWFYQPDTVGTYFSYFWFQQLRSKYPPEQLFNGLVIKTYIHGHKVGTYEDVVEDLTGIKSRLPDPDLKDLDLVGKDLQFLETTYGIRPNYKEEYIIEEHNGIILIIHINNQKVQWFNYLRANLQLNHEDIPEALLYFEEQVPN